MLTAPKRALEGLGGQEARAWQAASGPRALCGKVSWEQRAEGLTHSRWAGQGRAGVALGAQGVLRKLWGKRSLDVI